MKKFKLFLKSDTFKIIIMGLIINILCFVFGTIYSQAATTVKKLPYDYSWNYISPGENVIESMLLRSSAYLDISDPNLIIFWYELGPDAWYAFQYCVAIVDDITYVNGFDYDTTDLTTTSITLSFSDSFIGFCNPTSNVWDNANQDYAPDNFTFFGTNAILVENSSIADGYRHMPLYGTVELDGKIIIGQGEPEPTPTDPSDPDPIVPDIPTPVWPDFPDDITVENLLTWIGNCIKAIGTWLGNFGAWLKIALNKIITNVMNGIKSIIDNFKSLFKPFIDKVLEFQTYLREKFEYITEPISTTTIYDTISNTAFMTSINTAINSITNFVAVFTNTSEPNSYTIPIHLENMNGTLLGTNYTTQYIDLSIINPVKTALRTFIWALVTFGLFITIADSISNYINGGQDE